MKTPPPRQSGGKEHWWYAAATAIVLIGVVAAGTATLMRHWSGASEEVTRAAADQPPGQGALANPYDDVSLSAKAAVVYDLNEDRILYEKNPTQQLPLASLTKLMTVYLAHALLDRTEAVTIGAEALATEGDSGLLVNERWRAGELIDFTLITSSNDGAAALAAAAGDALSGADTQGESAFINSMNAMARTLGLSQTYFVNPSGLDTSESQSGAYGSALDTARLLKALVREAPEAIAATRVPDASFASLSGVLHEAENTNEPVVGIPGLIGAKTGFTDLAGGNLALAFDAGLGNPVAVVVLGSTQEQRFSDARALVDATLAFYSEQP